MGFDPNGGSSSIPAEERLNVFALVIYVPDPLGRFLDELRRELVPHYNPHAHVSVLPPRPLAVDWPVAAERVCSCAERRASFEIELTGLAIFPVTNVIYLEIGAGADELRDMHREMSCGPLEFEEPFPYHPHVTLAQEVPGDNVPELFENARRRWQAYRESRTFIASQAMLVQNTLDNRWVDLAACSFRPVGLAPARNLR
jgi:2'-5' RNA ligase